MIVDSSAICAIVFREPGWEALLERLAAASQPAVSAPTFVEAAIVLSARLRRDARGLLARFLQESGAVVIPFGEMHWSTAVDAWLRFGKGRHPAGLNFGDCLAYAAAKVTGQPLLCVGGDFVKTDLALAGC